jgi:hypothetical protein
MNIQYGGTVPLPGYRGTAGEDWERQMNVWYLWTSPPGYCRPPGGDRKRCMIIHHGGMDSPLRVPALRETAGIHIRNRGTAPPPGDTVLPEKAGGDR